MRLITPLLIAFLIGWIIVNLLFGRSKVFSEKLLQISISVFVGIGFISISVFWFLYFGFLKEPFVIVKEIQKVVLIIATLLLLYIFVREILLNNWSSLLKKSWKWAGLVLGVFIVFFILVLDSQYKIASEQSYGGWDSWAIWNLHAKFLYYGGENWTRVFSPDLAWSHNEYPLLLPGFIFLGWKFLSSVNNYFPLIVSLCYSWGLIIVLFSALLYFKGKIIALIAIVFLILPPQFAYEGVMQYADIPLSMYYLISLILLAKRMDESKDNLKLNILCGLILGFCVFTKNEGWSFVLSYIFVGIIFDLSKRKFSLNKWGYIILSFSIISIPAIIIKTMAPTNDIFGQRSFTDIIALIFESERYSLILDSLFTNLGRFNNGAISVFILLGLLGLFLGFQNQAWKNNFFQLFGVLTFTALQYFFIYIITPHDLTWHLDTSMTRLIMQLYPSILFCFFYFVKRPFKIV